MEWAVGARDGWAVGAVFFGSGSRRGEVTVDERVEADGRAGFPVRACSAVYT